MNGVNMDEMMSKCNCENDEHDNDGHEHKLNRSKLQATKEED